MACFGNYIYYTPEDCAVPVLEKFVVRNIPELPQYEYANYHNNAC